MESMIFVVFGADGHRQRESFNNSRKFNTERATVEVFNSDRTGSNLYTLIQITAEDFEACREEFNGQLSDGVFENSRTGEIIEIADGDTLKSDSTEYTLRKIFDGDWCVDCDEYGSRDVLTRFGLGSIAEAVLYAIEDGADIHPCVE